jgi:cytochrome o ubiquinol oxidase subunit 3
LRKNTFGGPGGSQLFDPKYVLLETMILLTSSFSCGLGILSAKRNDKRAVLIFFGITFLLGLSFLGLEINEFHKLAHMGDSWRRSGFLSAFFTLVGTHGLHITIGLLWMGIMMIQVVKQGLVRNVVRRLTLLSIFWHFLDVVWIFIFTIVYMMGVK